MKLFFTIMFVAAIVTVGLAQNISGSAHDFGTATWNPGDQICVVCHTPHNAVSVSGAVLWNRAVTTTTFIPYTSGTMNATAGAPSGTSLLCLSCHDGTIALEDFGGATGGSNYVANPIGADLTNDHPISFTYDAALATADGGLFDPTTSPSGLGGTITVDLLNGGSLECASCHDVHNSGGFASLLRIDNAASALCLTCHDK
ncbi:MAG: cytochrome c3 family protein [Bacteroidales bacterium]|nr:cytochrome c3 family protein [Bacteroidales bacterium]